MEFTDFLPQVQFQQMKASFPATDLYCDDLEYKSLIGGSEHWLKFHKMIFSKSFWQFYLPTIEVYSFSALYREHKSGAMDPRERRPFLYSRIDILTERAGSTHKAGIHIDEKQRICTGVLCFTNHWELDGGEIILCHPDGRAKKIIKFEDNLCTVNHQDKDGHHYTSPMKRGTKRFIQFSLNATWEFYKRS